MFNNEALGMAEGEAVGGRVRGERRRSERGEGFELSVAVGGSQDGVEVAIGKMKRECRMLRR